MEADIAPSPLGTRKCPFCAEEIRREAILCRYCGRNVEEDAVEKAALEWPRAGKTRRNEIWQSLAHAQQRRLQQLLESPHPPIAGSPVRERSAAFPGLGKVLALIAGIAAVGILLAVLISWAIPDTRGPAQRPPVAPDTRPAWPPAIRDAHLASTADLDSAGQFLVDLPLGCRRSSAYASADGAVNIILRCADASQSMEGRVVIKDGIVTEIR